jgi:cyclic pyranopterin phosphate synthase
VSKPTDSPEPSGLTHLDARGRAQMVDVGDKPTTRRRAIARARVETKAAVVDAIRDGATPKGDVVACARVAGILAAKQTSTLVPLCHPIAITHASIDCALEGDAVTITATIECVAGTGVEMEAMTAASIAALTVYDMIKGLDRGARVGVVELLEKSGGRSGTWTRG